MENFLCSPHRIRLLICANLDNDSVGRLSERCVPSSPQYDAIIACGPFGTNVGTSTEEEDASKIADMASIIAQLENIVCRVIYLPSQKDPNVTVVEETHLTPNSITLHGRKFPLTKDLFISGFSEPDLSSDSAAKISLDEDNNAEELEDVRVQTGHSVQVLKDILTLEYPPGDSAPAVFSSGIFVLLYHFSHTLNHFLFHLSDELDAAGVDLCIIASDNEEVSRLPKKFGKLSIASPGNLQQGRFTEVELVKSSETGRWATISIESITL